MDGSHRTFHHEQFLVFIRGMQKDFSPSLVQINVWTAPPAEAVTRTHIQQTSANKKKTQQRRIVCIRIWFERLIDQIKHIDLFFHCSSIILLLRSQVCYEFLLKIIQKKNDFCIRWVRQKKNYKNGHTSKCLIVLCFFFLILILRDACFRCRLCLYV